MFGTRARKNDTKENKLNLLLGLPSLFYPLGSEPHSPAVNLATGERGNRNRIGGKRGPGSGLCAS